MKPIRILHVIGGLNRGGAETMIMNLYKAIDKSKVQFDFVIHKADENDYISEIEALGGKVFVFPNFTGKNYFSYKRYWTIFLREHPEYKILHSHIRSYAIIFIKIAKNFGLKTIIHSHSTSNGRGIKAYIKNFLQLPIRWESDYLFACSKISGEWLFGEKAVNGENYRMVKNAINTDAYRLNLSIRSEYRSILNVNGKTVYGHVGRLSEPKNHRFLLKVYRDILKVEPESVLLLVGEGACRAQIETWIKELDISENVIMTGSRNDIPQLLGAMDVFLFPSLWEGLPMTVIEAQAAGLPCLISDKITSEVGISAAVQYLPIDQGTDCWVEGALRSVGKRFSVIENIKQSGFDVSISAKELESFYKSLCE